MFTVIKVIKYILYIFIIPVFANVNGQSINNHNLVENKMSNGYSFLVTGHIYGNPLNNKSVYPSASLLANLDNINNLDADFMILLGDNYWKADSIRIFNFINSFLHKIEIPIYNAVGNHDLLGSDLYTKYFGETFFSFKYNNDYFIILNSEGDDNSIKKQGTLLSNCISLINNDPSANRVFIFSHALLWIIGDPKYNKVYNFVNDPSEYTSNNKNELKSKVIEFIEAIDKNIIWFAGDIGTHRSLPYFFDSDLGKKINYIAIGMGETEYDSILRIKTDTKNEIISYNIISLTGYQPNNIETYNLNYWNNYFPDEGNIIQLLYKKFRNMLIHPYYWVGIISVLIFYFPFYNFIFSNSKPS